MKAELMKFHLVVSKETKLVAWRVGCLDGFPFGWQDGCKEVCLLGWNVSLLMDCAIPTTQSTSVSSVYPTNFSNKTTLVIVHRNTWQPTLQPPLPKNLLGLSKGCRVDRGRLSRRLIRRVDEWWLRTMALMAFKWVAVTVPWVAA